MIETVEAKTHAKRSPSSTKRRALCPASVVLEADRDRGATRYAAEGTVAHQVMELCILERQDAEAYVGRRFEADGFTFNVGMDMADAVNECLAYIGLHIDPSVGDVLMAESEVPIGHISGEEGATGTSDVIGITEGGTRLVVLDLKYGKGVPVFARDEHGEVNVQLGYYGLGALETVAGVYPIENVTLGIMQPRLNNFDMVDLTLQELLDLADVLREIEGTCDGAELIADTAGLADLGLFNPSWDACVFCAAKKNGTCPARAADNTGAPSSNADDDDFEDLSV